jgi:triacylglycerol lipase
VISRRPLLLVLAAVAVVALVGTGVYWLTRDSAGTQVDDGSTSEAVGPVFLVPGYGGGRAGLEQLTARLRAAGRTANIVLLPGNGTGDLRGTAQALDEAVDAAVEAGAAKVDVVGFSAGGLTARIWAEDFGGDAVARRVVTLGTPHAGTDVARTALALASGSCPEACQQLVPGSELLRGLEAAPDAASWTSVFTRTDEVVQPVDSAVLDGATNVAVQDVCADSKVTHSDLPQDPLVMGLVLRALDAERALTAVPPASECAQLRALGAGAG